MNWPDISIVVIGLNEEKNLIDTFNAVMEMDYPPDLIELIYVDTGSKDSSVEIAKRFTDKVFVEINKWPTSGLGRNRGLLEANNEIIHFIDGDISISKDYLKESVIKILLGKADAVTGYFIEKYPGKYFNRLMNIRRDDIIHEERLCESTNGGGTYLKSKLVSVNGYDERILKGQENELGIRYREKEYKIMFIDKVQGVHNFDINSIWDFIKVKFIYGKSSGYLLKTKTDINRYITNNKKSAKRIMLSNFFSLTLIVIAILFKLWYIIPGYYLLRISHIFFTNKVIRKRSNRQTLLSLTEYVFSFFSFLGILSVLANPKLKPAGKMALQS